ncbi:MAG: ATP-binding cassette domain-containing protein [Bifidobacteriaceae bacterium]|nr:ATP-binding cassette domain-containing protein [Bifidobacteriaceae bacterium]
MTALAQAAGLSVALGGHPVLRDLSLRLGQGERVALLGANGSGKSTLVKALLGLVAPSGGTVRLFGQAPGRAVPWGRLAYVPQDSPAGAGVPTSALEIVLAGQLTGRRPFPPRGAKTRALAALEQVGLGPLARQRVSDLSGGQRQRVLLARALARQPELLIMDEPLAGVDAASQAALVEALRAIGRLTCLVVLHEPGPFRDYLERGVVLAGGRVAAEGPLAEVAQGQATHHHHDPAGQRGWRAPELDVRA